MEQIQSKIQVLHETVDLFLEIYVRALGIGMRVKNKIAVGTMKRRLHPLLLIKTPQMTGSLTIKES